MILGILMLILAGYLFFRFIGFIIRLSWGILKFFCVVTAILLWPVSIALLLPMGLIVLAIPVVLICGVFDLIGKALS